MKKKDYTGADDFENFEINDEFISLCFAKTCYVELVWH